MADVINDGTNGVPITELDMTVQAVGEKRDVSVSFMLEYFPLRSSRTEGSRTSFFDQTSWVFSSYFYTIDTIFDLLIHHSNLAFLSEFCL
jgi:hypothetical protein